LRVLHWVAWGLAIALYIVHFAHDRFLGHMGQQLSRFRQAYHFQRAG
jgi:hypothetical protein